MSAPATTRHVLRHVLRASRKAFAGDGEMLGVARANIRERFDANAGVTGADEIRRLHEEGFEAARFLRENVVQNTLNERGNYEAGEGGVEVR